MKLLRIFCLALAATLLVTILLAILNSSIGLLFNRSRYLAGMALVAACFLARTGNRGSLVFAYAMIPIALMMWWLIPFPPKRGSITEAIRTTPQELAATDFELNSWQQLQRSLLHTERRFREFPEIRWLGAKTYHNSVESKTREVIRSVRAQYATVGSAEQIAELANSIQKIRVCENFHAMNIDALSKEFIESIHATLLEEFSKLRPGDWQGFQRLAQAEAELTQASRTFVVSGPRPIKCSADWQTDTAAIILSQLRGVEFGDANAFTDTRPARIWLSETFPDNREVVRDAERDWLKRSLADICDQLRNSGKRSIDETLRLWSRAMGLVSDCCPTGPSSEPFQANPNRLLDHDEATKFVSDVKQEFDRHLREMIQPQKGTDDDPLNQFRFLCTLDRKLHSFAVESRHRRSELAIESPASATTLQDLRETRIKFHNRSAEYYLTRARMGLANNDFEDTQRQLGDCIETLNDGTADLFKKHWLGDLERLQAKLHNSFLADQLQPSIRKLESAKSTVAFFAMVQMRESEREMSRQGDR